MLPAAEAAVSHVQKAAVVGVDQLEGRIGRFFLNPRRGPVRAGEGEDLQRAEVQIVLDLGHPQLTLGGHMQETRALGRLDLARLQRLPQVVLGPPFQGRALEVRVAVGELGAAGVLATGGLELR